MKEASDNVYGLEDEEDLEEEYDGSMYGQDEDEQGVVGRLGNFNQFVFIVQFRYNLHELITKFNLFQFWRHWNQKRINV